MDPRLRPYRSVLYIPGSKERALDKARMLPVDAIIFDLEDAVATDEKDNARETLKAALAAGGYGARVKIVRINGLDTKWGRADAEAVRDMDADAILLPKVGSAGDVDALAAITGNLPIWAMMETPRGMLNAAQIAAHPQMAGFVMGTNDLAKELQTRYRPDRLPLMTPLGLCLLAAKAEGLIIVDGVYNAFKDGEGLAAECAQGRDMGFDGKTLIHPAQVEITNDAYAPSEAEVDLARRQIAAFEEVETQGQGVAVVDGKIVENLHVVTAHEILAKAEAIVALQAGKHAMGFVLLILGVALWWAAHLFKRLMPERRAAMGNAGKGVVAIALVASILLMIFGYRMTDFVHIWAPPAFMIHINNLLVLIAIWMMSPAGVKGRLLNKVRHPMLAGFKAWAFAHLLVNGDLASIILFGGLLAWAVVEVIVINRSEPDWAPGEPGTYGKDAMFFVASIVLLGIIGYIHGLVGPSPFPS